MRIAFTLCSNNYLAQAKVLASTFQEFHPDVKFVIGLVDRQIPQINYIEFGCDILNIADVIDAHDLALFAEKFNIVELNTTAKPFFFKYFFTVQKAEYVIYLDPDIQVFSYLHEVFKALSSFNIVITPHMLSPVDDEFGPNDYHILRTGVFNLGFIALLQHADTFVFLDWWQDRCVKYGFRRDELGMFYDQIWINYVPAFFTFYYIIKHPGYNAANWNLHERFLSIKNNKWYINDEHELAFFHFSHFRIDKPDVISRYNSRVSFSNRPDVVPLFKDYTERLIYHNAIELGKIVPHFNREDKHSNLRRKPSSERLNSWLISKFSAVVNKILPKEVV